MSRLGAWTVVVVGVLTWGAGSLAAQGPGQPGRCDLEFRNTPNTRLTINKLPSGQYNTYIGGGVDAFCRGQDVTLRADSAESYGDRNVLFLIGNVHYVEPRARVDARRMTYFRNEERLLAEQDVVAVMANGTTMRGPLADYYRAVPGIRARARLVATGRPRMTLAQTDSTGRAAEPVGVIADRIVSEADSLVYASGKVEITRTDIDARGDSVFLDSGREFARLMRNPSIKGKGERPFTLSGETIDLYSRQRLLQRVLAARAAHAVSEDLNLTSDTIDLRVDANRLQRAYAWGASRARATSPDRDIVSDSMDILMPNQQVREVRAVRGAFAETLPDTSKVRTTERDWLRGDTIVARFDSAAATDTAGRPRLRALVANGHASSRYQIASADGGPARPSINYVRGREITVAMNQGAQQGVSTVTVRDQAAGVFLEPATAQGRPAPAAGASGSASPPRPAAGTPPRPPAPPGKTPRGSRP